MTTDVLIDARGLHKRYSLTFGHLWRYGVRDLLGELDWRNDGRRVPDLSPGEFWALQDVSLQLRRGEALAVIGPNGAGKSTLLKLLGGLIKPDAGRAIVRGRVGLLNELGTGMNPSLTGRENIYLNAALVGYRRRQVDDLMARILDFAGIGEAFVDAPMQTYSSGMWTRLAYAVAAHMAPDILLVDEVLAVGDLTFQNKCIRHMTSYLEGGGALILVSHANLMVQTVCQRALLLEHGQVRASGETLGVVEQYLREQPGTPSSQPSGVSTRDGAGGLRPVVVESVSIQAVSGGEPRAGEDALITACIRATRPMAGVGCAFAIMTGDQQRMITGSRAPGARVLAEGPAQLRCTVPRLVLAPGAYALHFVLVDAETFYPLYAHGEECPPTMFRVHAPPSLDTNLAAGQGMLVTMDVRWDTPADPPR